MTETAAPRERLDKPTLVYPFDAPPAPGTSLQVAEGVMWLRMPLPMHLNHINLWAIDDGAAGWAVVDTGMRTDETLAAWRQLFAQATDGRSISRVFCTHMHPDHVGMAGWLVRNALVDRFAAPGMATTPRYRLDVRLDDKLEGLALLSDDTIGRERRTLRARYQLVDLKSGEVLLDATAGSDAGFDVVNSEYAVIAAEQTALENLARDVADRIVTNVAVNLRKTAGP